MDEPAVVTWAEGGESMTAQWRSANGRPAPARVEVVSDSLTADGTELTIRQLGAVMKPVTAKVAGRYDGKAVSEIVRSRIPQ